MKMGFMAFEEELTNLITRVPGLDRRKNNKFKDVEEFVEQKLEVKVAIAYLSDVKKQFPARVGQTLAATPDVVILLASQGDWEPYLERLREVSEYATGLGAFSLWIQDQGVWRPRFVVGRPSSKLRAALADHLPSASVFPS